MTRFRRRTRCALEAACPSLGGGDDWAMEPEPVAAVDAREAVAGVGEMECDMVVGSTVVFSTWR